MRKIVSQKSLSSKIGILTFANFTEYFVRFASLVILSRYFLKSEYGSYRQFWMIYSLITILLKLGLPKSLNYFLPQSDRRQRIIFTFQAYLFLLFAGIVVSIFLVSFSDKVSYIFNNDKLTDILKIGGYIPIFMLPVSIYKNFLVSIERAYLAAIISIIFGLIRFSFTVIIVVLNLSLLDFFRLNLIYSILFFMVVSISIIQTLDIKKVSGLNWRGMYFTRQFSYSIPIGLSSVIGMINKLIDKLIVSRYFNPSMFAIYSNGAFEIPFVGLLLNSIVTVLMPELVRLKDYKERFIILWQKSIIQTSKILFPLTFMVIFFSREIVTILFSRKYEQSAPILAIYGIRLFARVTNFGMILMSIGRTRVIFLFSVLTLLSNFILNIIFLQYTGLGIIAPSIATVVVTYLMNILQLFEIKKYFAMKFTEIFPFYELGKAILKNFLIFFLVKLTLDIFSSIIGFYNPLLYLITAFIFYLHQTKDFIYEKLKGITV